MLTKVLQLFLLASLLLAGLSAPSRAQDQLVTVVEAKGQFVLSSLEGNGFSLSLTGPISRSTVTDFLDIRRNREIAVLALNSLGGDLDAGIMLAELVSLQKIQTWVPKDAECASACALIFFAGNPRIIEGRVGVHQYRTVGNAPDTESEAQERLGRLIELLNSFDTPAQVVEKLAVTKPNCVYWFDDRHADMVNNVSTSNLERIEGALECVEQNDGPYAAPRTDSTPRALIEIRRDVQVELNRVGCNLGGADGTIGKRSRRALEAFSLEQNIPFDVTNFDSEEFLRSLRSMTERVCRVPLEPLAPNLEGSWQLSARCPHTGATIRGSFIVRTESAERYSLLYKNNLGETGSGKITQKGNRASVTVRWSNGSSTTNHMTVDNAGARMSGRSSNGCVFEAWR